MKTRKDSVQVIWDDKGEPIIFITKDQHRRDRVYQVREVEAEEIAGLIVGKENVETVNN